MFPICVGHAHTFEPAIDGALPAIDTAVHVIFQNEAFGGAVKRDEFDGFGWTVFDAQTAAYASGWVVLQIAAKSFRSGGPFDRIKLSGILFEKRLNHILEHGSNFHNANPFHKIMTRSCAKTKMAPNRHQSPTVWSMRRRVSKTWNMDITKSKASDLNKNDGMPFNPPR